MKNNSAKISQSENDADNEKNSSSKALSVIGVIACIILVPILALNICLIVQGITTESSDVPNIGGYFPLMVKSGSMSGCIEVGDLIICQAVENTDNLKEGDVITFWDGEPGGSLVTHRILEVTQDEEGKLAYRTKGDANNAVDADYVYPEDIVGMYQTRIPYLGDVALFMQTVPGLVVCVIVPLALFVIYDTVRRKRINAKSQAEADMLRAELERLKQENAAGKNSENKQ